METLTPSSAVGALLPLKSVAAQVRESPAGARLLPLISIYEPDAKFGQAPKSVAELMVVIDAGLVFVQAAGDVIVYCAVETWSPASAKSFPFTEFPAR